MTAKERKESQKKARLIRNLWFQMMKNNPNKVGGKSMDVDYPNEFEWMVMSGFTSANLPAEFSGLERLIKTTFEHMQKISNEPLSLLEKECPVIGAERDLFQLLGWEPQHIVRYIIKVIKKAGVKPEEIYTPFGEGWLVEQDVKAYNKAVLKERNDNHEFTKPLEELKPGQLILVKVGSDFYTSASARYRLATNYGDGFFVSRVIESDKGSNDLGFILQVLVGLKFDRVMSSQKQWTRAMLALFTMVRSGIGYCQGIYLDKNLQVQPPKQICKELFAKFNYAKLMEDQKTVFVQRHQI